MYVYTKRRYILMAKQNNYAKENNTFTGRNNILECIL